MGPKHKLNRVALQTSPMLKYPDKDVVTAVTYCDMRVVDGVWGYGEANRQSIDEAWRRAIVENPAFFNGEIHMICGMELADRRVAARLLRTDFKSYLHWRRAGFPQAGILDGFGSAIILSREGAILLGRQRAGNINAGLAYLPGGFIDARDAGPDGCIDIAASVAREVHEETGLTGADLQLQPGFLITQTAAHVSIAVRFQSGLDAEALKCSIARHIAADPASELVEAIIVRDVLDLEGLAMPHYARVLLQRLLPPVSQDAKT